MNLKNLFKNEQVLIAEIHNEFDTAQDRLLQQANEIIASSKVDAPMQLEDKAKRLESIGFVNTPIVKKLIEIKKKRESIQRIVVHSQEQADLIQYYKREYPFQKFITESELDRICTKYKLIHAPVANYIKDVPEKNLKEIESAKPLNESDKQEAVHLFSNNVHGGIEKELLECLGKEEATFTQSEFKKLLTKANGRDVPEWTNIDSIDSGFDTAFMIISRSFGIESVAYSMKKTINKKGLFICAPPSHFNLNRLTQKSKLGFFTIIIVESKDPIVYRYCKGGVQILSKWGLEASDEALLNPIDN